MLKELVYEKVLFTKESQLTAIQEKWNHIDKKKYIALNYLNPCVK